MQRPLRPIDLPPPWFDRWEERAAIVQECNNLPTDIEGTRQANRIAFDMTIREMEFERCLRQSHSA